MNSNLKDGFKAALKIIEKNKMTAVIILVTSIGIWLTKCGSATRSTALLIPK